MVEDARETQARDLFMWSVLQANEDLVRVFWMRCTKPVHMALLGAHLCRRMAKASRGSGVDKDLTLLSERMEQWAIGILDEV